MAHPAFSRAAAAGLFAAAAVVASASAQSFNTGWRFALGDPAGAHAPAFDDAAWSTVGAPHDWGIEQAPRADAPSGGGGGYFRTGVGWYRKTFVAPKKWQGKIVTLRFGGVYRRATVWLNGQRLGEHAYGYTPFEFEVQDHLRPDGPNVVAVRVDNSAQPNSRWYSGSGLLQGVSLHGAPLVHLAPGTLSISTPEASAQSARVVVEGDVVNRSGAPVDALALLTLTPPPDAHRAPVTAEQRVQVPAGGHRRVSFRLSVEAPRLWSPDDPQLWRASLAVSAGAPTERDVVSSPFGIRTIRVSPNEGFVLNGEPIELFGGCVHHDHGPLGGAACVTAERRKARLLKQAGFNAVRTAHNPPSEAFLDACDRLGLLVVDEAFDGWRKKKTPHDYGEDFDANWRGDLTAMIERDRNHPSVVMWSIGNEVYERGDASGARLARQLADTARRLDPTRPVTMGLNGLATPEEWPRLDRVFEAVDVAGYNYESGRFGGDHARVPRRVMMTTESYSRDALASWRSVAPPHVIGDFVWTAVDYLGEAGIGRVFPPGQAPRAHWEGEHFPWHGAACGDIDLTGFRKPVSHYRNIVWNRGEKLYVAVRRPVPASSPGAAGREWGSTKWAPPQTVADWTWPDHMNQPLVVEVYSRWPRVRLELNGRVLGEAATGPEQGFLAAFPTVYEPGELTAVGLQGERAVQRVSLRTAGAPAQVRVKVADTGPAGAETSEMNEMLVFVEVEVLDAQGARCWGSEADVSYTASGGASLVGVASSDLTDTTPYTATHRRAHQGRALAVVRVAAGEGSGSLSVTSPGLRGAQLPLPIRNTGA